jgi:hypothetical protein
LTGHILPVVPLIPELSLDPILTYGSKKLSALEKLLLIALTVSKGKSRSSFTAENMENLALTLMLALVYGNNYLYRYMRLCLLRFQINRAACKAMQ